MRHTFELSAETRKVINNGNVEQIADAMQVTDKYIYRIRSGDETDPFAKFMALFQGVLAAGFSVTPWITKLRMIEEHYRPISKEFCIQKETAEFVKESNDVAISHINGDDLDRQLAEVQQANAEGQDLERALIHAINERDRKHLYNGKPVSYDTRNKVRGLRTA